jgi:hypothetical protein
MSCFRLWTKPYQSLFVPESDPSGLTVTQLIAPMRRATVSTSSTIAMASCLSGIVRLQPENPKGCSARSAAASLSGWTATGT